MSQFLETIKERVADSQRRLQASTVKLQQAQAEHQAVSQEFVSWQNAFNVEARREQLEQLNENQKRAEQQKPQAPPQPISGSIAVQLPALRVSATGIVTPPESLPDTPEISKTKMIKDVLLNNSNGITPAEVWKKVQDHHVGRAYVYSVLKRLKDKKQVLERRGKYYLLMPKTEEKENLIMH
jgi:hypothetical protein